MSTSTRITHLVAGTPWEGTSDRTSPVFNPATGEQTGVLDLASADLVGEVVANAKAAWKPSRKRSRPTGSRCCRRAASERPTMTQNLPRRPTACRSSS